MQIRKDQGRIEKWIMRRAFDTPENPFLPKVCQRELPFIHALFLLFLAVGFNDFTEDFMGACTCICFNTFMGACTCICFNTFMGASPSALVQQHPSSHTKQL
jgi:hypothetical protein